MAYIETTTRSLKVKESVATLIGVIQRDPSQWLEVTEQKSIDFRDGKMSYKDFKIFLNKNHIVQVSE